MQLSVSFAWNLFEAGFELEVEVYFVIIARYMLVIILHVFSGDSL